jgi:hypothetical protein
MSHNARQTPREAQQGACRVLALDPGTTETAWLVWDGRQIHGSGILPNEDLREQLHRLLPVSGVAPEHLAVEMIASMGMPVGREVFETVLWIGRLIEAWNGPYTLVYRQEVKLHLCGSVRAKDPHVRQALLDLVGAQGTKKAPGPTHGLRSHTWSALGVAICWWDTKREGE